MTHGFHRTLPRNCDLISGPSRGPSHPSIGSSNPINSPYPLVLRPRHWSTRKRTLKRSLAIGPETEPSRFAGSVYPGCDLLFCRHLQTLSLCTSSRCRLLLPSCVSAFVILTRLSFSDLATHLIHHARKEGSIEKKRISIHPFFFSQSGKKLLGNGVCETVDRFRMRRRRRRPS